jgi:predicted transposase/invertase (TIGR01784 family)
MKILFHEAAVFLHLRRPRMDGLPFTGLMEFVIAHMTHTDRWSWARFFGSGSHSDMKEAAAENEKVGKAMLIVEKLSADEEARLYLEYEEMMRRDYVSRIEGAKSEGEVRGVAKGIRKGIEKGREEANIENARRMKADGVDAALIAKYTELSIADIAKL